MTETRPHNVLYPEFRRGPRLRVIDCQGDGYVMSALKMTIRKLDPGMDLTELAVAQDKHRREQQHIENMREWRDLTRKVCREATDDPLPHMDLFIKDLKGARHD